MTIDNRIQVVLIDDDPHLRQALGQRTRRDVGRAAGRPWHDHGHGAGWPVLGEGAGGEDGCCESEHEGFSFGREDSHGFVTYIVELFRGCSRLLR